MFSQMSYWLPVVINLGFILGYVALYHFHEPTRNIIKRMFHRNINDVAFFLIFGAFIPLANIINILAHAAFCLYLLINETETV